MNSINNIYHRLRSVHLEGGDVRGCVDAACELIMVRLEESGRIDLASVLGVLEAAKRDQDALLNEIAQVTEQLDAEYGISPQMKERMGPTGGES